MPRCSLPLQPRWILAGRGRGGLCSNTPFPRPPLNMPPPAAETRLLERTNLHERDKRIVFDEPCSHLTSIRSTDPRCSPSRYPALSTPTSPSLTRRRLSTSTTAAGRRVQKESKYFARAPGTHGAVNCATYCASTVHYCTPTVRYRAPTVRLLCVYCALLGATWRYSAPTVRHICGSIAL